MSEGADLEATIIIPAYKRPQRLRMAVEAAVAQDLDPESFEVIVVDSSPDDENQRTVEEVARTARCSLRCFRKKAEGPGPSRNMGAAGARGRVFAFTDSDCVSSPGWLRAGLECFASDDRIGLVQGRTLPEEGGVPRGPMTAYVWVEREGFLYETANIMYRREAFEEVGGFRGADLQANKERPVGGEDTDLAWRVKRAGWRSAFAHDALVRHEVVPLTLSQTLCDKRLYIFPRLVRDFPELRRFFFGRVFYNAGHALFLLLLLGLALAPLSLWTLTLASPYLVWRFAEPSVSMRGLKRPIRVGFHALRDGLSMGLLLLGSLRYRSLLL